MSCIYKEACKKIWTKHISLKKYIKDFMIQKQTRKKRFFKYLGQVGMAALTFSLMTPAAQAVDPVEATGQVIASEGGRSVTKEALKIAKSKPSMLVATTLVCISCVPIGTTCPSASLCVACGILIAKTMG